MLFRNQKGDIIEINKSDFNSDKEYYSSIQKYINGKSSKSNRDLLEKQIKYIDNVPNNSKNFVSTYLK